MNSTVNLAYCSDENGLDLLNVSLNFLLKYKEKYVDLNVYIYTNVSEDVLHNKVKCEDKTAKIIYRYVDTSIYNKFYVRSEYTLGTFFRFEIFKEHIDKMLYIDTDVFVKKDLLELYNTNIPDNCCLAGIPDYGMTFGGGYSRVMSKNYVNGGVLLIDINKCKEHYDNILKLSSQNFENHDQDMINSYFDGKIYLLDVKYNTLFNAFIFEKNSLENMFNNCVNSPSNLYKQPLDMLKHWSNRISNLHIVGHWKKNPNTLNAILNSFVG